MASVKDYGEKRLIREVISEISSSGDALLGIGDDAAIFEIPNGHQLIVSTDKIPEDLLAIQLGLMDPYHHGRYLAAVNISDMAAMGGTPLSLLITLALPNDFEVDYLREFYRGLGSVCREFDIGISGGDLGWGTVQCMSATALGYVKADEALKRSEARHGDHVYVTGPVGLWGTALLYFLSAKRMGLNLSESEEKLLQSRLIDPVPQVEKGGMLAKSGIATTCMDITDGFSQSLTELAEHSKVGLLIEEGDLPVHELTQKVAEFMEQSVSDVVFGPMGLDLELLGTIGKEINGQGFEDLNSGLFLIGSVDKKRTVRIRLKDGSIVDKHQQGWQHFSKDALSIAKSWSRIS